MSKTIEDPDQDYDDLMKALAEPHKSPDVHLCYLQDKPQNLEISELRGYEPVTVAVSDKEGGQSARRLVKVGDLVLAKLPQDVHEARQRKLEAKTRRQQQIVKQQHIEEMRKAARSAKVDEDLAVGDIQTEVTRT